MTNSLLRLYDAVSQRRTADPGSSRTAKLFAAGRKKIAQKVGEEAVEVAIDAVAGHRQGVIEESADLLYNLTVLWVDLGIQPDDVFQEIERREQIFGIAEKLPKKKEGGQ
jgi:phosphoribosyl-ATP pyrophosphohydrolase